MGLTTIQLNLGCPEFCPEYFCVDLHPEDSRVAKADAVEYMRRSSASSFSRIRAFQLIEHLPNVGGFFEAANRCLEPRGELLIRTDNAEYLPFYLALPRGILGWGAHASAKYTYVFSNGHRPHDGHIEHYAVFTKRHLREYARRYGFSVLELKRVSFGARLLAIMRKEHDI